MNDKIKTDWDKLKQIFENDLPIAYDDEDRANGLHDPNSDAEVEAFFANAKIVKNSR